MCRVNLVYISRAGKSAGRDRNGRADMRAEMATQVGCGIGWAAIAFIAVAVVLAWSARIDATMARLTAESVLIYTSAGVDYGASHKGNDPG